MAQISTMEHLLMQIFDRKKWIEGQLRHQFESYGESVAYNVLAEGKQPPPWLWTAGSDGCAFPDPKGRLFSVPCTDTPSANNNTYFTLPAFKGYEVSGPNNFSEPCASEYVFSECHDKVVHSANKLNSDRITESEVLACAEFVPLDSNQHSNSKQEICSSENDKNASHLGKSMNKEESGRVTRSRAYSLVADDVRESSGTNFSLYHQNAAGGRVSRSRSRSAAEAGHLNQLSEPFESLDCVENSWHEVVESQSDMLSAPSINLNHLSCTASTCIFGSVVRADNVGESSALIPLNDSLLHHSKDGGRVTQSRSRSGARADSLDKLSEADKSHCIEVSGHKVVESRTEIPSVLNINHLQTCIIGSAVLHPTSPVHSTLKIPSVEPKRLLFDGNEEHGLNKNSGNSCENKNQCSSETVFTNSEVVTINKELLCGDNEKVDGDEKDFFQISINEGERSSNCGRKQEGQKLLEVENSRSHSYVTLGNSCENKNQCSSGTVFTNSEAVSINKGLLCKDNEKVDGDENDFFHISTDEGERSSNCGRKQEGQELFEIENSRSCPYMKPGHQVFMSKGRKKSSFRASTQDPIEENYREKIITETSGGSIETTGNLQHAGSALPSQTDDVLLEAQTAAVRDCGNLNTTGNGNSTGTKGGNLAMMSKTPRTRSSQHKVPYLLRSSRSLTENHDCMLANGSVSCSKKNSMLPPDINAANQDHHTKNIVNCSWITPNSTEVQGAQERSRYFLRSLDSHDRAVASFRSYTSNASHLIQPVEAIVRASEISWPKRRKVEYGSNNILATSPRFRFKHSSHILESGDCSSNFKTASQVEIQPIPMSSETETGLQNTVSRSPSKSLDQSKKHVMIEDYPCMKWNSQRAVSPLPSIKVTKNGNGDRKSGSCLQDEIRVSEERICKSQKHSHSADCPDSLHGIRSSPYGHEEQCKDKNLYDTVMSSHVHDTATFSEYDHAFVGFDENMPEFEGFSIACSSVVEGDTISNDSNLSTLAKERACAIGQLCKSKEVHTPLMCTSLKYKIHQVPDVYKSSPAGVLEDMNTSSLLFNDANMKHVSESDNAQLAGLYGHLGLEFDGSFVARPYSFCLPSSSVSIKVEARKPPLTPPVMKFSQVVSSRSGASSEKVGSNPELVCFRIDENSIIDDENGNIDELDDFKEGISVKEGKELSNRKALRDITAEHQNKPILGSLSKKFLDRGSLDSVNSEVSTHLSPAKRYAGQSESKMELKENTEVTANRRVRKPALSLRNKSNKPRVSAKINERSRSHGNLGKEGKPSNVVSNVSSFIPLIRQKQQAAAPLKGRKEIKIKALEAADAAKRLEEKKQNEREMRKAAAKLEREKLEQETIRQLELKQKQKEEERKKKEAAIAARKRQREEEGRKEKGRKRRCTEETERKKREQEGKIRADRVERELRPKASDEKEHTKEPVDVVKAQLKPEKIGCKKSAGMQPNISKASALDDRKDSNIHGAPTGPSNSNNIDMVVTSPDCLQDVVQTRASINKKSCDVQSYEMSPYRDSDDEDGEEEIRRERKHIPLWARRECLDEVIRSTQHLDPVKIFSRKGNFIIGEVLQTANLQRPF